MLIKPLFLFLVLFAGPVYAVEAPVMNWADVVVEQPEEEIVEEEKWIDKDNSILCNCWAYVTQQLGQPVSMASFVPNSDAVVGGVAIEWFGNLKHVSYVTEVTEDGVWVSETNYVHCEYGERFIPFTSPRLSGFWHSY